MSGELPLHYEKNEDGDIFILEVRGESGDYIDPDLAEEVAKAIRQYPNQDAPQWMGAVAAVLAVERHLARRIPS